MASSRRTGAKAASAASRVLRDDRYSEVVRLLPLRPCPSGLPSPRVARNSRSGGVWSGTDRAPPHL